MFNQETLRKVFAEVKEKGVGKEPLDEIEITDNEVYFSTRTERYVYSRGHLRPAKSKSLGESKPFQLAEATSFDLNKSISTALEFAKKNSYLDKPEISHIRIYKQSVSRDDNLVSNVGKHRETILCEIHLADSNTQAKYTTNLQGQIVDVAATNVKPEIKFQDTAQMQKSLAEIKPLFGGKISVSDFSIGIARFSFTASDPKNPTEINTYRFDSQEFLQADNAQQFVSLLGQSFDLDEVDFSLIPKVIRFPVRKCALSNESSQ
ncbi:MAG: hypothetical protein LH614_16535 [Pyrinomonadaceae bacterium]|nr:hypothetical protein [Pyrinomonadaceae bacterium]